ncbi:MAG TPA: suppressor of fused domain protein [Hymenobacter sp.]
MSKNFSVLAFPPSDKTSCWVYSTLGMSTNTPDALIELHILSNKEDATLIELLTVTASFHRTGTNLGLHHTVNFGRPWQDDSTCSYGFLSLPYLSGETLEIFDFDGRHLHNLWLLPITEGERNYKIKNGWDALERQFEECGLDYLNPQRSSCT